MFKAPKSLRVFINHYHSFFARLAATCASVPSKNQEKIGAPVIFNRKHKVLQRDAAARRPDREHFRKLRSEIAERLVERLDDTHMK